ncbi:MAG: hypothetical protein SGJ04_01600 [Bacteroidota bacterium]|nr:hypothetical protein [Bacteroidota bacterium]
MACDLKTYYEVNHQVFMCLSAKLKDLGYPLDGNRGSVKGPMGIVIVYAWNETDESIQVQVTEKSLFLPCFSIYARIEDALDSCRK